LTSAYLLVSHGSRVPRPQIALDRLAVLVDQKLTAGKGVLANSFPQSESTGLTEGRISLLHDRKTTLVKTATLECHPQPLHQQMIDAAHNAHISGFSGLKIVPLFLLPGVHVQVDLPSELVIAKSQLKNLIILELCPYLGSSPHLATFLARQFSQSIRETRIILAHGSRRLGGNTVIENLAHQLNAIPCYWSVAPNLEWVISNLDLKKEKSITILPYFLFSGGITDAIALQVQQLQQNFPQISFKMGSPLGATTELSQLIIDLIHP
jgi:hypothetical protein